MSLKNIWKSGRNKCVAVHYCLKLSRLTRCECTVYRQLYENYFFGETANSSSGNRKLPFEPLSMLEDDDILDFFEG